MVAAGTSAWAGTCVIGESRSHDDIAHCILHFHSALHIGTHCVRMIIQLYRLQVSPAGIAPPAPACRR